MFNTLSISFFCINPYLDKLKFSQVLRMLIRIGLNYYLGYATRLHRFRKLFWELIVKQLTFGMRNIL